MSKSTKLSFKRGNKKAIRTIIITLIWSLAINCTQKVKEEELKGPHNRSQSTKTTIQNIPDMLRNVISKTLQLNFLSFDFRLKNLFTNEVLRDSKLNLFSKSKGNLFVVSNLILSVN